MPSPPGAAHALRSIAAFEALKGLAALAALLGLLDLAHRDVRHLATALIGRFGLDPGAHYPSLLLHYADLLPGAHLLPLVLLGLGYVALRLAEAYGLWCGKPWGEWLAALSGGLYIPFELAHLWQHPSATTALVLASNLLLTGYLGQRLWTRWQAGG